jgi:hypothetical protein
VCSLIAVALLYGANLRAQWSVFDDHEIMWFMGSADRLSITQIVPRLMLTEVGPGSDLPRFRPAYYTLRLIETWLWGKQPALWYGFHLLILAFFITVVWYVAESRIGWLAAGLLAFYTLTFLFWSGIFSALGPGETYATLGLALYLLGVNSLTRAPSSGRAWGLLLLGTLIAAGSKENFALLALPLPFLLWWSTHKSGQHLVPWLCTIGGVLWSAWIVGVVIVRARAVGGDVYANPIGIRDRLNMLVEGLSSPGLVSPYGAALAFAIVWYFWRRCHGGMARASLIGLAWSGLLVALYLSQVVFYNGAWPAGNRYDFPGMLCLPALLAVFLWYIGKLALLPISPSARRMLSWGVPVLAFLATAGHFSNIGEIRATADRNVAATSGWTALVSSLVQSAKAHPQYAVVMESNDPADFEPLRSYPRFLLGMGASNPIYLEWTPRRPGVTNYKGSLSDQLAALSEQGEPGLFEPLGQLDPTDTRCIGVVVSGAARWPCRITLDADWRRFYQ